MGGELRAITNLWCGKEDWKEGNMEPIFKFQTQKALGGHLWKEEKEHKERNKVEDVLRPF